MTCRVVISGLALALMAGCSASVAPDRVDDPPDLIASALRESFAVTFGVDVPAPAYFNGPEVTSCTTGPVYLTSVAYLPDLVFASRTRVHVMHRGSDGMTPVVNLAGTSDYSQIIALLPAGVVRVLTILLTYPTTVVPHDLGALETEQAAINAQHATFAQSRGFAGPIVTFEFTNLVIDGSEAPSPANRTAMMSLAGTHGTSPAAFDVLAVINLDPGKTEGGFAQPSGAAPFFVYMGNYGAWTTRPTQSAYNNIAAATYHHEIGHLWGWQHEWTRACGALNPSWSPFITSPALFGWEDTDGDRIPEINDPTPYGRR